MKRNLFPLSTNPKYIRRIKCWLLLRGIEPEGGVSLRDVVLAMAEEAQDRANREPRIRAW